jgi:hypothetical protein
MNLTQSRNLRRIAQAARLDRRLAEYWAAVDYVGGPVPGETELHRVTAAEHYQLQQWLRRTRPATF